MKLLLDTHIWAWSLLEPHRLRQRVRDEITSSENEIWLSPVSLWEILALISRRRIIVHEEPVAWVARCSASVHEAFLTNQIVMAAHKLAFAHTDPIDRFLAATAKVLDLTLVTADERLLGLSDIKTLANR